MNFRYRDISKKKLQGHVTCHGRLAVVHDLWNNSVFSLFWKLCRDCDTVTTSAMTQSWHQTMLSKIKMIDINWIVIIWATQLELLTNFCFLCIRRLHHIGNDIGMTLPWLGAEGIMFLGCLSIIPSVCASQKYRNTMSYKLLVEFSPNLQFWGHILTN